MPTPASLAIEFSDASPERSRAAIAASMIRARFTCASERGERASAFAAGFVPRCDEQPCDPPQRGAASGAFSDAPRL